MRPVTLRSCRDIQSFLLGWVRSSSVRWAWDATRADVAPPTNSYGFPAGGMQCGRLIIGGYRRGVGKATVRARGFARAPPFSSASESKVFEKLRAQPGNF